MNYATSSEKLSQPRGVGGEGESGATVGIFDEGKSIRIVAGEWGGSAAADRMRGRIAMLVTHWSTMVSLATVSVGDTLEHYGVTRYSHQNKAIRGRGQHLLGQSK
ncbi:hypothetical protein PoB_002987100 [Plakobranchus ocellatus]|uniref:Uncharacterized protein n=1 Tax=Plakobranchus ocellatus TaxID=259542 RepID=A0AAV4A544_9GAST|nr:hypothetical protein PoB_002987100 [Plakobranchus ocellatus]